jgi:hypothetical protein
MFITDKKNDQDIRTRKKEKKRVEKEKEERKEREGKKAALTPCSPRGLSTPAGARPPWSAGSPATPARRPCPSTTPPCRAWKGVRVKSRKNRKKERE